MAEYINRETLLKAVEKMDRLDKETNTKYEYDKEGYILLIKSAPTADVAEVVRCKNCIYFTKERMGDSIESICTCGSAMIIIDPDKYCSYGKRK